MNEEITLVNGRQVTEYMIKGVMPKRVYREFPSLRICYVFDKNETTEVWNLWKNGKLRY